MILSNLGVFDFFNLFFDLILFSVVGKCIFKRMFRPKIFCGTQVGFFMKTFRYFQIFFSLMKDILRAGSWIFLLQIEYLYVTQKWIVQISNCCNRNETIICMHNTRRPVFLWQSAVNPVIAVIRSRLWSRPEYGES